MNKNEMRNPEAEMFHEMGKNLEASLRQIPKEKFGQVEVVYRKVRKTAEK